jgi:hypothetical protein
MMTDTYKLAIIKALCDSEGQAKLEFGHGIQQLVCGVDVTARLVTAIKEEFGSIMHEDYRVYRAIDAFNRQMNQVNFCGMVVQIGFHCQGKVQTFSVPNITLGEPEK